MSCARKVQEQGRKMYGHIPQALAGPLTEIAGAITQIVIARRFRSGDY
jgi:hypothetical protein